MPVQGYHYVDERGEKRGREGEGDKERMRRVSRGSGQPSAARVWAVAVPNRAWPTGSSSGARCEREGRLRTVTKEGIRQEAVSDALRYDLCSATLASRDDRI
ncbi:hypothetical protein GCM10010361_34190 [Streptomyces olivaceiscleroticus]|uniref:Transposase n=1 Tax=Streptomyces olivaceiscleroticus TaxID=68245 RepID=A0ABP3JYD8_9ACTN